MISFNLGDLHDNLNLLEVVHINWKGGGLGGMTGGKFQEMFVAMPCAENRVVHEVG